MNKFLSKSLLILIFTCFLIGCSSEQKLTKQNAENIKSEEVSDKYNHNLNYDPELRIIILKIINIFENNANTFFPEFYFVKNNQTYKIYYFDSKTGRSWGPNVNIEKVDPNFKENNSKNISILNLYLTNKREDPIIKIDHNENIVINRSNYKENEPELLFLLREYVSFLETLINDRNLKLNNTLFELKSILK